MRRRGLGRGPRQRPAPAHVRALDRGPTRPLENRRPSASLDRECIVSCITGQYTRMGSVAASSRKRTHLSTFSAAEPHLVARNVRRKTIDQASSQARQSSDNSSNASSMLTSKPPHLCDASRTSSLDDTSSSLSPSPSENQATSSAISTSSTGAEDSEDTSDGDSDGASASEGDGASPATSLPLPPKQPRTRPASFAVAPAKDGSALLERLRGFLPQMAAANKTLEVERAAGTLPERDLERVDEEGGEGGYIEMNLGLGVLEERDPDAESSSSESEGSDEEEDMVATSGDQRGGRVRREKDVLGRLMGQKRGGAGVQIQELGDG